MNAHFLDGFALGTLFLLTSVALIGAIEAGFHTGMGRKSKTVKAQASQVRAIMGATLGLLAFMTAFTFATAQSHYEVRVANMVEETRVANNAFLLADFLAEPWRSEARGILREYIGDRLSIAEFVKQDNMAEVMRLVDKSEAMQLELWEVSMAANRQAEATDPESSGSRDPFAANVIALMDIHALRLQAALANRIPSVIWLTLYFTGVLSMFVMGYQAGLVSTRSPFATMTLALAFAAFMMLITDLDRPTPTMFKMNQQVMIDLAERMDILHGPPPGD
jgi:hypothetical protein